MNPLTDTNALFAASDHRMSNVPGSSASNYSSHFVPSMEGMDPREDMSLHMDSSVGNSLHPNPPQNSPPSSNVEIPVFKRDSIRIPVNNYLGNGSEGVCQRVYVPRLGWCVMKTSTSNDQHEINRRRELVHSAMLNHHPNIVSFYGVVCNQDMMSPHGFLMEYMAGGSLTEYLRENHNIDEKLKIQWAKQIALATAYMHSRRILHRDLNPNNILLSDRRLPTTVKICDFGLSREMDGGSLTLCTGTSVFMAPEVIDNKYYGTPADVYSYAMTLYTIFNERTPFQGEQLSDWKLFSFKERLLGKFDQFPSRPVFVPGINDRIEALIKWCWSTDPLERPSMDKVCEFLEEQFPEEQ